jgi:cell wall-associated NlpC family hydrolase
MKQPYFATDVNWHPFYAELLSWQGTPYRHLGNFKGRGADCTLFLATALLNAEILTKLEYEYYSRDWHAHGLADTVVDYYVAHERFLRPGLSFDVTDDMSIPPLRGDFIMMKMPPVKVIHHCSVLLSPDRMIHCINGVGVEITRYADWWRRHSLRIVRIMEAINGT